jgi:hypothetical protein
MCSECLPLRVFITAIFLIEPFEHLEPANLFLPWLGQPPSNGDPYGGQRIIALITDIPIQNMTSTPRIILDFGGAKLVG